MLDKALKLIRIYHNLSQKSLAEKLEMSTSHICEVENGKKSPSLEMLGKYSKFFNIPLSNIMLFSENLNEDCKPFINIRIKCVKKIIAILEWSADTK